MPLVLDDEHSSKLLSVRCSLPLRHQAAERPAASSAVPGGSTIDIHVHCTHRGRPDEHILVHQQNTGVGMTVMLPAGETGGLAAGAAGNDHVIAFAERHRGKAGVFAGALRNGRYSDENLGGECTAALEIGGANGLSSLLLKMMQRIVRLVAVFFFSVSVAAAQRPAPATNPTDAAASQRPNIVFILLDNLGQEWFDCYGSEEHCTPQIDRLAAAGVRFANCYTSTVCGPSRVELLTGRYPFRTGWYLHHDAALYSGGGFDPKREVTIARVLRDAGYVTGISGKWQVNNLYDEPDALRQHGFQESLVPPMSIDRDKVDAAFLAEFQRAIRENNADFLQEATRKMESRYWDPVLLRQGKREVLPGRFGPDVLQEFAIDFVKRHRHEPFFLYYPMVLTHGSSAAHALTPTPENRDHPPANEHEAFGAMVRYADRLVGEFVASLETLGVRENTIVFIASDNGTDESISGRRQGRMVKGGLYHINEPGSNIAFMVNSPKLVPGGRIGSLADFTDVFPTICDFARVLIPSKLTLDGHSYKEYLQGKGRVPRQWIFNEYRPDRVVRDTRYKLWDSGKFYDLETDPDEARPLLPGANPAADHARAELQAVLQRMPADTPLPFPHRSLSAFRQRAAAAKK